MNTPAKMELALMIAALTLGAITTAYAADDPCSLAPYTISSFPQNVDGFKTAGLFSQNTAGSTKTRYNYCFQRSSTTATGDTSTFTTLKDTSSSTYTLVFTGNDNISQEGLASKTMNAENTQAATLSSCNGFSITSYQQSPDFRVASEIQASSASSTINRFNFSFILTDTGGNEHVVTYTAEKPESIQCHLLGYGLPDGQPTFYVNPQ